MWLTAINCAVQFFVPERWLVGGSPVSSGGPAEALYALTVEIDAAGTDVDLDAEVQIAQAAQIRALAEGIIDA